MQSFLNPAMHSNGPSKEYKKWTKGAWSRKEDSTQEPVNKQEVLRICQ